MTVSLNETCENQEEFLFKLYASTREDELAMLPWDGAQKDAFLKMQFEAKQQWYQSAYPGADHKILSFDDEPAGRILVKYEKDAVYLVDIALLPAYRNRGIGSELIRGLITKCKELHVPFRLQVATENHQAFRLYEKMGFTVTSTDAMYRQMEIKA